MAGISPDGSMVDGLEKWRELFRGADIYDVIDHAILVAAADSPQEFRRRREQITERLYNIATTAAPLPLSCSPGEAAAMEGHGSTRRAESEKHSKVASCNGTPADAEDDDGHGHDNGNAEFAEALLPFDTHMIQTLADQIDEDTQEINEVLRIKQILINYQEQQSVGILLDSLTRLQLMQLSVDKLSSTGIGGAVTALRKHRSPEIRQLVRDLVRAWRSAVDEWVSATNTTIVGNSDTTSDSSKPSAVEDEDRLLTPPMDFGAFFLTQATAIQHVSEFFDGMDDDGNVISNTDSDGGSGNKIQNNGVTPSNNAPVRKQQTAQALPSNDENTLSMKQDLPTRQEQPLRQPKPRKLLNADGNTLPMRQGLPTGQGQTNPQKRVNDGEYIVLGLPERQEPALRQTNLKRPQEPRSQLKHPRELIKLKLIGTEFEPRRLSEETPRKKRCVEMKPRRTQDPVAIARKPPAAVAKPSTVAVARKPPSGHVNKPGMPMQASAGPKVGIGKRKIQLADMGLEATKRKLHEAYENARKQRSVQVMELCDIPSFKQSKSTPPMKSRKNNIGQTPNVRRK